VFLSQQEERTERLRTQFGALSMARAVEKDGDRRHAEAALEERTQRVEQVSRPAARRRQMRARFVKSWKPEDNTGRAIVAPSRCGYRQHGPTAGRCAIHAGYRQPVNLNSRRRYPPWIIHWFWQTIESSRNRAGQQTRGEAARKELARQWFTTDAFRGTGQPSRRCR